MNGRIVIEYSTMNDNYNVYGEFYHPNGNVYNFAMQSGGVEAVGEVWLNNAQHRASHAQMQRIPGGYVLRSMDRDENFSAVIYCTRLQ